MSSTKKCPSCGETKSREEGFYRKKLPDGSVGVHSSCRDCIKARERKRRARECISCKTIYFHAGSAGVRRRMCDYCSSIGRWCNRCESLKPFSEFYKRTTGGNTYCKPCARVYNQVYRYGVTEEQLAEAGDTCGACGRTDQTLVVDHSHNTGEFRGMLCGPCNSGMGMFGDDINRLLGAVSYLHRSNRTARV